MNKNYEERHIKKNETKNAKEKKNPSQPPFTVIRYPNNGSGESTRYIHTGPIPTQWPAGPGTLHAYGTIQSMEQ